MIVRASQLFLPTLREAPADADAVSHKLLVRGGFIRQVGAGLFSFLPLGWRVHQKVVQIIREEIDAIGGQEMLCPVLTPAELWKTSGRYEIPEVFKLEDRGGREFVLSLSHEETFTFHARELQSYKQLPQILYHFSTKERDESRPRGGLLRVREFVMKDAYSFDRDEAGMEHSFQLHAGAYRRIFERCGLQTYEVEAESGIMGGRESWDYLAPTGSGENELVLCENGDYQADREAMPVVTADGRLVLGLLRGDDQLNEEKLTTELESGFRPATDDEIRATFGAGGGSLGPVGVDVEVVADELLRDGQFVTGANRDGWHLRGVEAGRDYQPRFADIRALQEGDRCPICGGTLSIQTAIEVGHIFKLGTHFSERFEARFLDEDGREKLLVMGSYGVGPARTIAAIVEQHHDEHGIAWPEAVAPYDAHVVALPGVEQQAEETAAALDAAGRDVLLDDRDQRAGEKFADADLIGCPIRVTVGKKTLDDGAVDVRDRATGDEHRVPIPELSGKLAGV